MLNIYISNALPIGIKIIGGLFLLQAFVVHLGQEGLGLASQYQSIITMSYGIFNALIFNFAVKNQWPKHIGEMDFTAFLIWVIKFSVLLAVCIALLSSPLSFLIFSDKGYEIYMLYAAVQIPFVAVYIALSAKMCADKKQITYNVVVAASTLVSMFAIWYCTKYLKIAEVFIALAFFYAPAFIIQTYVARAEFKKIPARWFKKNTSYDYIPVLKISFVAVVSAFLAVAIQMIARKIILVDADWGTVGDWQIVTKISESYLLLASIPLFTFFLPKYAALTSTSEKKALLLKIATVSIVIVGATGSLIFMTWHIIAELIVGAKFNNLRHVFGIQVLGDIFKILSWVFITAALGENRLRLVLIVETSFALLYCGLIYFLFPRFGLVSVIASSGAAYMLAAAILFFKIKEKNERQQTNT